MLNAQWLLDKRFVNRVKLRYEKYDIQAGILKDGPHYAARSLYRVSKKGKVSRVKNPYQEVDGMKARRRTRIQNGTLTTVSRKLRRATGINIFLAPFQRNPTPAVKKFKKALFAFFGGKGNMATRRKTAEARLVDALRTPIKKRQYGPNSGSAVAGKGFNRRMFDTGQIYSAIKAKIKRLAKGGT